MKSYFHKKIINGSGLLLFCLFLVNSTQGQFDPFYITVSEDGIDSADCVNSKNGTGSQQPCKTLHYALQHLRHNTQINVHCGHYQLYPQENNTQLILRNLVNVIIMGSSKHDCAAVVECVQGASLSFCNMDSIRISNLIFEHCGDHGAHPQTSLTSAALYFHHCKDAGLVNVEVTVYEGNGIVAVEPRGIFILSEVTIIHNGTWGSGIRVESSNGNKKLFLWYYIGIVNSTVQLVNCKPRGYSSSLSPPRPLNGITVILGDERMVSGSPQFAIDRTLEILDINVTTPIWHQGIGIYLRCLNAQYDMQIYNIHINQRHDKQMCACQMDRSYNITDSRGEHRTNKCLVHRPSNDSAPVLANQDGSVYMYTGLHMVLEGVSLGRLFEVSNLSVFSGGKGMLIVHRSDSQDYHTYMDTASFQFLSTVDHFNSSDSSVIHRNPDNNSNGIHVLFEGEALKNAFTIVNTLIAYHQAEVGGGIKVEFKDNSTHNKLVMLNITCKYNSALKGGGLALMFTDGCGFNLFIFTITTELTYSQLLLNSAEEGGGLYVMFMDEAINNSVQIYGVGMFDNMATKRGGGFHCVFQDRAVNNSVMMENLGVIGNYIPLTNSTLRQRIQNSVGMGGGGYVEFSSGSDINTLSIHNILKMKQLLFIKNSAARGVGGGLSMVYKSKDFQTFRYTGEKLVIDSSAFVDNIATYGSGLSLVDISPSNRLRFPIVDFKSLLMSMLLSNLDLQMKMKKVLQEWKSNWNAKGFAQFLTPPNNYLSFVTNSSVNFCFTGSTNFMQDVLKEDETIIRAWKTNECMLYIQSITVRIANSFTINCAMQSQGIRAINSQLVGREDDSVLVKIFQCVAINGGAMALYGQSSVRVMEGRLAFFAYHNLALRRGGGIYVDNVREQNPSNGYCSFIQMSDRGKLFLTSKYGFNIAGENGNFAFIKDVNDCADAMESSAVGAFDVVVQKDAKRDEELHKDWLRVWKSNDTDAKEEFLCEHFGYLCTYANYSNETQVAGAPVKVVHMNSTVIEDIQELIDTPPTVYFYPGKEQQLPFNYTLDQLNNTIDSVFAVQVLQRASVANLTKVQLNSFSRFTSDFKVIVHGIPLRHHMLVLPVNISSLHPPQLLLQSVDNEELVLVVNIQMECCPPGYIFTHMSGHQGTCQCGLLHGIQGIKTCSNVNQQEVAILHENVWAGFVDSQHPSGCNSLLLYTAKCPLDYCHNQPLPLPNNHSKEKLDDCVCGRNNRKGLLCGDCLSGYSININFGGSTPKCTQCSGPLSKAGILIWILAEWIPMLLVVAVVLVFNVDIVSGYFNSFLLFAQLIAFSSIRGDLFNTPQVYKAFASIYRFIYGIWNLDFFGQLLPPYCLTPNDHFNTLQIVLLQNSVGVFPLVLTIALVVLERSAEKWICCHPLNKCLRRFRKWTAKFSGGQTYDRALPAFVILGFTRFLVSSSYVLVSQTITSTEGETTVVVWWQGTMPYGSVQHLTYFLPAILILFLFVFLPFIFLLTLPLGPQLFGKLIYSVPILKCLCGKLQSLWSDIYTDKWMYHFINVFQGCYRDRFRFVSSFFLGYRIALFFAAILVPRLEDSLRIQLLLAFLLLLFVATFQPYKMRSLNVLDVLMLGDLVLVLLFSLQISDNDSLMGDRHVYAYIQLILIYLPLIYPLTLIGRKIYSKRDKFPKCMRRTKKSEDGRASPLLGNPPNPRDLLGPIADIHELHLVFPSDGETTTADGTTTGEATSEI